MVVVALAGLVVNLIATRELAKANRSSLNIEGSYQHLLTDSYAFVATADRRRRRAHRPASTAPTRSRRSSSRR